MTVADLQRACARHLHLRALLVCLVAATLGACGFQLRGTAKLPFTSLYVQVPDSSALGHEIKRTLRVNNTRIADTPAAAEGTLVIMSELRERQILSLGGQGRVREYRLLFRMGYQVTDGKAKIITSPTEIMITRDISFNDEDALAKESEEALLYRDMQTDAVQQLLRRLQATRLPS